jgi:hypothetical protein
MTIVAIRLLSWKKENVLLTDFVGKEILVNIMQLLINVQGFEGSLASDDFLQRRPLMSEKGEGSENQNENQNENAQPDDNAQQLCQSTQTPSSSPSDDPCLVFLDDVATAAILQR